MEADELGSGDAMLSRDEMQRIIERAARLDAARSRGVSLSQLREIASELDISPEALDAAVSEVLKARAIAPAQPRTEAVPGVQRWLDRTLVWWARRTVELPGPVLRVAAALTIGYLTQALETPGPGSDPTFSIVMLLVILVLPVATGLPVRKRSSQAAYLLEVAAQWTAWSCGTMWAFGRFWDDVVMMAVPLALLTAVVGSWLRQLYQSAPLPSAGGEQLTA